MRTALSDGNPHGASRAGFVWEKVPADSAAHLDFGCYRGDFLNTLTSRGVRRLVGVDAAGEPVREGRALHPHLDLHHAGQELPLPFEDASFTSISLMDVLEHVHDQPALLRELHRLLVPGGTLVITVPRRHIFSILDLGNLKFRVPRLHRWFFIRRHSEEEYRLRYVTSADGLIGDIDARKGWHEHFSSRHMRELLEACGFRVVAFDGSGLFRRAFLPLELILGRIRPLKRFFQWLTRQDARLFASMNLFCHAVREGESAR